MSWVFSTWVYPVWDCLSFLELGGYFFPRCRDVFDYYLLKYFLMPFLFVFFFWDIYDSNVGAFNIVPEVSEVGLISFNSFIFIPLCFIYFHHSIIDWLFFISSRSFLNISCIFSILVSSLFICNSVLFSIFWITFTITILNSFSGRLYLLLFYLLWWIFIMFFHLLNISLPFHFV